MWTMISEELNSAHKAMFLKVLEEGLEEDAGFGDITSSSIPFPARSSGSFRVKERGVLSGIHAIRIGYGLLEPSVEVTLHKSDGERIEPGDLLASVEGPAAALLTGERVILNLIQHLSGIATSTAKAAEALKGSPLRVCDTRKTLPGLRALQKYAVRCGGGLNHRMRLDSGAMIKDNHIAAAGGIRPAVEAVRRQAGPMIRIEVECETEEQIREAVKAGADIIMLDNKSPEEAERLCRLIPEPIQIELSGGITPERAGAYRECGAHWLSIGSLTHSVRALDISFDLEL